MTKITPVTLPKWGLEMYEGTVTAWHLAEGDNAEKGAELVDIETDKIVNSMEVEVPGTLRRIIVPEGEVAPVGTLIAVLADPSVDDAEIDGFISAFEPVDAGFEPSDEAPQENASQGTAAATPVAPDVKASPLARRAAEQAGIDITTIKGTGHGGKVLHDDVARGTGPSKSAEEIRAENETVNASPNARKFANEVRLSLAGLSGTGRRGRISLGDAEEAAIAAGLWSRPVKTERRSARRASRLRAGVEQPFTGMRKSIATALVASKQTVPHFYTIVDIRIDALKDLRQRINASGDASKVSVNDLLIRATALALKEHPEVNVHVSDNGVTVFEAADICIAVAVQGGLITPVLRDAGNRTLQDIAVMSADLAARARSRQLEAPELKGGTFTVSNLGMYGVREFDAIINAPQGAILAVGGPRREAIEDPNGGIGFATVISVTLSADHRAIDGVLAAQFLATLKRLLENPGQLED
ncbi:2-oxo acid dehydrogenase subunit E2 [Hoeflea poritis]|uniref:Dihydrolipoamide acetyltransferase component of pyruvate dehydrogenase complex n=1 Tax=Hoeflea poritis TaxID=2993659 RepID=A0ABT4VK76_9HYPH|nr:2-oxo acid dehydrogenase subunit E2 [Hoeflea poritis]MDA4845105.1 2-oxo acid dehydrogenase subunit E2 [Hoeflea poritis]